MTDPRAAEMLVDGGILAAIVALPVFPFFAFTLGLTIGLPLAVIASVLPILNASRNVRRRNMRWRALRSQCATCGYDLRSSTARCPECGEPFEM